MKNILVTADLQAELYSAIFSGCYIVDEHDYWTIFGACWQSDGLIAVLTMNCFADLLAEYIDQFYVEHIAFF